MHRFGPDGNARLTAGVGLTLLVLSGLELLTLLLGLQRFLSWHVFIGIVLIPPIALKLVATGWRFLRYYTRDAEYVRRGPPMILMRLLAPILVAATVLLFGSGIAMGFTHGGTLALARSVHGPASVVWSIALGIHVLAYLLRAVEHVGRRVRSAVYPAAALVVGAVVAVASLPAMHDWTRLHHDHHKGRDDGAGTLVRRGSVV